METTNTAITGPEIFKRLLKLELTGIKVPQTCDGEV